MYNQFLFKIAYNAMIGHLTFIIFLKKYTKQMQNVEKQKNMEEINEKFVQKSNYLQNSELLKADQQSAKIGNNQRMQRFKLSGRKTNSFTKQEMIIFANKFQEFRSKWGLYTRTLQKTEKQIKNLFYNSLRKLATQLSNMQKKMKLFQKNKIEALILHHLINISYTVKDSFDKMEIGIQELLVFKVKDRIFDYCFRSVQYTQQDLIELSKNVRKLKFYLKNMKLVKNAENQKQAIRLAETMINKETEGSYQPKLRLSRVQPTELSPSPQLHHSTQPLEEPSPPVQYHMSEQNMIHVEHHQLDWQLNNYQMMNNIHYPYMPMNYPMHFSAPLGGSYTNYSYYQSYQEKNQKIKAEISEMNASKTKSVALESKQKNLNKFNDKAVLHSEINIKMKSRLQINNADQSYQSIILHRQAKNEQKQ